MTDPVILENMTTWGMAHIGVKRLLRFSYTYFEYNVTSVLFDNITCFLTHWGKGKMDAISQKFQMHFLEWKCLNFD